MVSRDSRLGPLADVHQHLLRDESHVASGEYPRPTSGAVYIYDDVPGPVAVDPWQISYSEIYVTPKFWPDFGERDLAKAIEEYQKRERRFGK